VAPNSFSVASFTAVAGLHTKLSTIHLRERTDLAGEALNRSDGGSKNGQANRAGAPVDWRAKIVIYAPRSLATGVKDLARRLADGRFRGW
jgi:hypothetical protein